MTEFTKKHLSLWLERHFIDQEEIDQAESLILDFLEEEPDYLENHSWREILRAARQYA
jgi:hypothetical protein